MSGQAVQYDDAFLLNEIENGKDVAYPMTVAGDAGTWLSLHHELSTYISEDVSSKAYHKTDRMETIVKFCQISFAHGKHIQDLAIGARIHEDLLRYTHISAKLAYSALSNLVTRNLDSATIVLTEAAKLSDETKLNLNQDLPIPAILLLRNSLGSTKATGDMERCSLVCNSSILLQTMARSSLQEKGSIPPDSEEDESLRLFLTIAIMDNLLDAGLAQDCVDLHLSIKDDGQLQLGVKNEIFKYIDQYCFQNKRRQESKIEITLSAELNRQISILEESIEKRTEEPESLHKTWIGLSLLLSSLSALLTHESNVDLMQSQPLLNCIPDVVKALGLAHQHFPRSKGGRQDDKVKSETGSTIALPNVKRDCITIISNLCHQNTSIQNQVRELGGISLILAQCNIDDLNPYLREHAMYCIRNLLDENKPNQDLVDSIKPVGVQQTAELTDLGYRTELQNGKVGVSRIPKIESINDD